MSPREPFSFGRLVLRNRHAVWALAVAVSIFGVVAWFRLPVQLFPDTAPPLVNVVTSWPGAAGTDVADDLSTPLEEAFAALEGVAKVKSTSQDNLSLVSVEFQYDRNAELAAVDVQNAIARVRGELPSGIAEPQVLRFDTSDRPVLTVGLTAGDPVRARRLAEDAFAPRLQRVDGVAAVDVFGGSVPAVLVDVDPAAVEAHRLPIERVAAAVRDQSAATPAGRVRGDETWTMLRVDSRVDGVAALGDVPIGLPDGSRLLVRDVASVSRGALDDESWFAIDGEPAIALQIFKTDEGNTVDVVRRVLAEVEAIEAENPQLTFLVGEESATFTETVIRTMGSGIWQALALAAAVIFLFLGRARASAVAIVSMPLSYLLTFALMAWAGLELNLVTLTATILSVGMVVDASVVVLENVTRHREQGGLMAEEAAVRGTDEVLLPVLAGAATTLIVLVPLVGLDGFIGRIFRPLATTLIFAFTSSVVVALLMVPMLTLYTGGEGRLDRLGMRIASPFQRAMDRLRDLYVGLTARALRWRKLTVAVSALSFVLGVVGMRLAGAEVLPKMDTGSFFVALETPSGTSLAQTAEAVRAVERIALEQPEVVNVQSQAGFEPGMRFFGGGGVLGPTQGFVTVTLTPRDQRDATVWEVEERVRQRLTEVPGLRSVVVKELGQSAKATTSAPIDVRVSGADPLVLDRLGDEVLARVAAVPDVVEPTRTWRRDHERVRLDVDALRAAQLDLSPLDVGRRLALGSEGLPAGDLRVADGQSEPIRVRLAPAEHPDTRTVLGWPLVTTSGEVVPARALAAATPTRDQGLVTREDLSPTLDVTAWVDGRALSFVAADVAAALDGLVVPQGYEVELKGERDDLADARGKLLAAVGASIVAVYLLLVAQFRSWIHPVTVMVAIPLSLSGVAAALHIAGKAVSMPVMVGMVLLVGTVVNSSILLVDVVRELREQGVDRREALLMGVSQRFRPILMTSVSTIVGMIPLAAEWALGAERLSPLATAAMGGMTTATFLTIVVIPVFYDLAEDAVAGLARLRPGPAVALAGALLAVLVSGTARAEDVVRLGLDEAVALAMRHSPALTAADARVDAAVQRQWSTAGRALPKADVQARYSRLSYVEPAKLTIPLDIPNVPAPEPIQLGEAVQDQYSLRLGVEQPLFTGGALVHGWAAARHGVSLAEAQRDGTEGDLRLQVAEAWYGLAVARELASVVGASTDALTAHLERVERLREAGRATDVDVARLRARLAELEAARVEVEGAAEVARLGLVTLVGLDPDAAVELVEAETAVPGAGESPEVAVARASAELQDARAGLATSALWPRVAARVGWQYENPNSRYFPIQAEWNDSWDASIVLTWTAWDWGTTWHEARAVRREAWAADEAAEQVEERVAVQIAQAEHGVRVADQRVVAAEASIEAAERAWEVAERAFEAGTGTSFDVVDREVELLNSRAARVRSRADARLARERLNRIRGGVE